MRAAVQVWRTPPGVAQRPIRMWWLALSVLLNACAPSSRPGGASTPIGPGAATNLSTRQPAAPDLATVLPAAVDARVSGPVTLSQLLVYAAAHGPALRVARQQALIGDAEVEGAERLVPYNPSLAVRAGGRTAGGVTRFEFGTSVQQRFEIGGERGTRIEAAQRSRQARQAKLSVTRWQVHAQVHALYYQWLVREQQLVAADQIEQFVHTLATIIDKRVEAGAQSPLDTIVVRAELAKARQLVIAAKQAHRMTTLKLAEVVGWPLSVPLKVAGKLGAAPSLPKTDALLAAALQQHPSKQWLALEVRAAQARVTREDRKVWPDPSVGFSYGREAAAGGASHVWVGTVKIPLPLWERNQLGRARARADVNVARAKQQAFERALGVRIAAAVARVEAAQASVQVYGKDILPALKGNLKKLQRAFELGEIDVLEMAQIQQRILRTQQAALKALDDYYVALAALEALSGVDVLSKAATLRDEDGP